MLVTESANRYNSSVPRVVCHRRICPGLRRTAVNLGVQDEDFVLVKPGGEVVGQLPATFKVAPQAPRFTLPKP